MDLQKHIVCGKCGSSIPVGGSFCPYCGSAVGTRESISLQDMQNRVMTMWHRILNVIRDKSRSFGFVRCSNGKAVAGVCAGLARRFHWNVMVVRGVFVIASSFGFAAAVIYGFCWLAFDEDVTHSA